MSEWHEDLKGLKFEVMLRPYSIVSRRLRGSWRGIQEWLQNLLEMPIFLLAFSPPCPLFMSVTVGYAEGVPGLHR
jgi:hypothetical protein